MYVNVGHRWQKAAENCAARGMLHACPPSACSLSPAQVEGEGWSDCARKGLAVKAVKGTALLFYSLKPNGEEDPASTHGSCPTLAGEKWSATRWVVGAGISWQAGRVTGS